MPLNQLPPNDILPATINEIRSDVLELKYSLHASPREVCDPMQPGVSVGNLHRNTTGTMGLQVTDSHGDHAAFLSIGMSCVALSLRKVENRFANPVLCI
jgi:hypothetical protein